MNSGGGIKVAGGVQQLQAPLKRRANADTSRSACAGFRPGGPAWPTLRHDGPSDGAVPEQRARLRAGAPGRCHTGGEGRRPGAKPPAPFEAYTPVHLAFRGLLCI